MGDDVPMEVAIHVNEISAIERRPIERTIPGWHVNVGRREQIDALARLVDDSPGSVPIVLHVGPDSRQMPKGIAVWGCT